MNGFPSTLTSRVFAIEDGLTWNTINITPYFTGNLICSVTFNAYDATPTWVEISMVNGVKTSITGTAGSALQYSIMGDEGSKLTKLEIEYE